MMNSDVAIQQYVFPSWDVYPRVHYFQRRYSDLLTRCNRALGTLPRGFYDARTIEKLDQIKKDFEGGVNIIVIGEKVAIHDLIITSPEKQETSNVTPGINVYIYHACIENLDLVGLEKSLALLATSIQPGNEDVIILSCKVESTFSEKEAMEFRSAILQSLPENISRLNIHQENILLSLEGDRMKKMVSDEIERKLIYGFQTISSVMRRFDLIEEMSPKPENVLESRAVVNSLRGFLRSTSVFREIMDMSIAKEEKTVEKFVDAVISRLCRILKCSAVGPLGTKYSLKSEVCNSFLHEIDFEEALTKSISKNTRYHLRRLKAAESHTCHKFDFLAYPLLTDMKPVVKKTEEQLSSMKQFAMVIRRLLFEIDGYLKQSVLASESRIETTKLPEMLRRDILGIEGVYGIGNIYGRLEIHLDEKEDQTTSSGNIMDKYIEETDPEPTKESQLQSKGTKMETDIPEYQSKQEEDNDSEQTKESKPDFEDTKMETDIQESQFKHAAGLKLKPGLRNKIALEMTKHNFHYPYSIRVVHKKPVEMNGCFEPGDTLVSPTDKSGTIGAFGNSKDGTLYGLTCAHVVSGSPRVFVKKDGKNPFSFSQEVVKTGQDLCRLIDIAALKVLPSLQHNCRQHLENNNGLVKKVEIATSSPEHLVGTYVHKFGAKTGLTKGIIISVDYSQFGPKAEDYVVIVDPLAANSAKDLPDLSNAFRSLTVTAAEDERMPVEVSATAKMLGEDAGHEEPMPMDKGCSSAQNDNKDVPECSNHNKRKLKHEPSPVTMQGLSNAVALQVKDETKENALVTDEPMANMFKKLKGDIVDGQNEYTNDQSVSPGCCTNTMLYVRNSNETEIANCDPMNVFAEKGDSGSVICAQDLSFSGRKYLAISMLSAGDFEITGLDGKKALSFLLKCGLAKLFEHCQLNLL